MVLYVDSQFASPYAMSVFVALSVKRVPFEVVALDLAAGQAATEDHKVRSLTSRVPTLVDGGFSMSESSAIAEYLDDKFPGDRLFPTDIQQRARARQVQAWLRSDLAALRADRSTEVVFYAPSPAPLSAEGAKAADKLLRVANALVGPGQQHICENWSIADVDLALMLNRLIRNGDPVPAALKDYASRQWAHPAVQAWVNQTRPALQSG